MRHSRESLEGEDVTFGNEEVARLIVADSLAFSFGESGGGDAEIEDGFHRLQGEEGEGLTSAMMNQYLPVSSGGGFDLRLADKSRFEYAGAPINVNAAGLRQAMIGQFESYLRMSIEERAAFRENLRDPQQPPTR